MSEGLLTAPLLQDMARRHGLSRIAAVPAESEPHLEETYRREEIYRRWIREGRQGGMTYLSRHTELKYRPRQVLSGTQTLLLTAVSYYRPRSSSVPKPGRGRVARYAWGRDYHKPLKKRLRGIAAELTERYPGSAARAFVDSSPLDERYYAARAGLGFQGRNHALILPGGSWYVLGEILTTLPADWEGIDVPPESPSFAAGCPEQCSRCIEACPTGALEPEGGFDARRCLSYLTIEHRGELPEELRPALGDRLFGCDTCQDVCPLNREAEETGEEDFRRDIAGQELELAPLLAMKSREEMVERFAGSPIMRASRERLAANAAVVAANRGAEELLPQLRHLRKHDPDPAVRVQAEWAAERMRSKKLTSFHP